MKKCLIITGGSSGIGASTAELFLKNHWDIINISRRPCEIANIINLTIDLSTSDWQLHHGQSIEQAIEDYEQISLVHNAGILGNDTVQNIDAAELQRTLQVNVISPAILNTLVLPHMQAGSSIIYIGSTLSEIGVANCASYVTSKHAIAGLMRATCQDFNNTQLHTCCICPGFTSTPMLTDRLANAPEEIHQAVQHFNTAKRLIEPNEIAELILFAANNPVINGAVLHANLGQVSD